jgi:GNAT superfamily N-acetyltransferase
MTIVITHQGQAGNWTDRDRVDQAPAEIQVGPARPADEAVVCAMVSQCSGMSLYHRFHGSTDGLAYTRALFATGSISRTLLAWIHGVCVGMANLAPDDEGIGHLGVLVEDAWQRRGIGTRLVAALLRDARARGESRVGADVLGEDEFIVHALRPAGPLKLSVTLGTYSIEVDLIGAGE